VELLGTVQGRVEGGGQITDQKSRIFCQTERASVEASDAIGNEFTQPGRRFQYFFGRATVSHADLIEIDAEITHDAFDDLGPQAIIVSQRVPPDGRQPAIGNRCQIGSCIDFVLHVSMRQASDGTGAKS
jgi:hypothetical protein